jgi:hypothetical protein
MEGEVCLPVAYSMLISYVISKFELLVTRP